VDFIVDSLNSTFDTNKFGIEIFFFSDTDKRTMSSKRTLDDEYTPGTFRIWAVESTDSSNKIKNYFQWRPVFYFYDPKNLENSTLSKQYDLKDNQMIPVGLGSVFFNSTKTASAMNISFGLPSNYCFFKIIFSVKSHDIN
jgi:hypothetical protein